MQVSGVLVNRKVSELDDVIGENKTFAFPSTIREIRPYISYKMSSLKLIIVNEGL